MRNLVFGSAERPGNSADAAEITVVRDNDVAIGQGARPTDRPEKASAAARHNGAQRGASAENEVDDRAENLPKQESVNVLVPETPDGAIRLSKPLFGVVPKTLVMTHLFASPDSAYVCWHVDPDDTELKLPAVIENAEWTSLPKRKEHRSVSTSGSSPEARRGSQKNGRPNQASTMTSRKPKMSRRTEVSRQSQTKVCRKYRGSVRVKRVKRTSLAEA